MRVERGQCLAGQDLVEGAADFLLRRRNLLILPCLPPLVTVTDFRPALAYPNLSVMLRKIVVLLALSDLNDVRRLQERAEFARLIWPTLIV